MPSLKTFASLSLLAVVVLVVLLWRTPRRGESPVSKDPLVLYCAAGLQLPVEKVVTQYRQEFGVPVHLQYGGSGTLLSNLRVARKGDLYLAGDESYLITAASNHLVAEILALAQMAPVIAVPKGNPKGIQGLNDLLNHDVGLASPETAAVGRIVRQALQKTGHWTSLSERVRVFKPTVNDLANDLKLGAVEAAIIWDATVRQYDELESVPTPELATFRQKVSVGILTSSTQASAGLHFARYLAAKDRGLLAFQQHHYETIEGDQWADVPKVRLFSGAMLRPAIEQTLRDFERREGVEITTVYNGCGILTAQMRAGQRPDAYFSCDVSFMTTVADLFLESVVIADNDIVILVPRKNPAEIASPKDLCRSGLKIGLAHPEKSAMGALTKRLLEAMDIYEAVQPNVKIESPTGDFLVNQMRTGSLDAVVVCRSNAANVGEHLQLIPIDHSLAKATQPYAIGQTTEYHHLMTRLTQALESTVSRGRFESVGFHWRYADHSSP
jgi:ABC-type molybdate transport system substrate-binding protein